MTAGLEAIALEIAKLDGARVNLTGHGLEITRVRDTETHSEIGMNDVLSVLREHNREITEVTCDFDRGELRLWLPAKEGGRQA